MKITCPNCSTSYQVPDDYIGAEGRAVRCANCKETWHAEQPDSTSGPMSLEEGLDSSQGNVDNILDAPADEEQSQDDIDALFDSPSAGEEQDQDGIDALFDSPSAGEEQDQDGIDALFDSPSAGEEQDQDGIDALFDSPSAGEEQDQDGIDALFDSPPAGEEQDQAGIDSLFDSPAPSASGPDEISAEKKSDGSDPFVIKGEAGDGFESPVIDLMDAAAFEAQKVVARGNDIETSVRRKRRRKGAGQPHPQGAEKTAQREWALGGAAVAASLVLIVGLFAAPKFWVRTLPDLASLYATVGMDVNVGGVDFDMVDVKFLQKGGAPVLTVEAELVNPGVDPVILPSVQFSVLGKTDNELYSWAIGPDSVGLGPGERKRIKTSIAAPSQAKYISLRVFHQ